MVVKINTLKKIENLDDLKGLKVGTEVLVIHHSVDPKRNPSGNFTLHGKTTNKDRIESLDPYLTLKDCLNIPIMFRVYQDNPGFLLDHFFYEKHADSQFLETNSIVLRLFENLFCL